MAAADNKKILIDISSLTLLKILFIIVIVYFLYYIRGILLLVFVALILSSAFEPWVDWLQRRRLPRTIGIILIYLAALIIIFSSIVLIITPISAEINDLSRDFPIYWSKLSALLQNFQSYSASHGLRQNIENTIASLQQSLSLAAGGAFGLMISFFGGLVSIFIVLVMTFYLTAENQLLKRTIRSWLPAHYQPYSTNLINRLQEKLGWWLRGQLALCLIIFFMCWAGLSILGVKYALVLALFAGVTELIPYLGPFVGALPAAFIAFTQSPLLGILVILLYFVIQQLENYLIVPKVMQKAVGLNPLIIIIAILIGAKLAGIAGIILAVPVTTAASILVKDIFGTAAEEQLNN